jgi:hypothetical protein
MHEGQTVGGKELGSKRNFTSIGCKQIVMAAAIDRRQDC